MSALLLLLLLCTHFYSSHLVRSETLMQLATTAMTLALTMVVVKKTVWTLYIEWKLSHAHTEQKWSTG
jgi:hypothetical protein